MIRSKNSTDDDDDDDEADTTERTYYFREEKSSMSAKMFLNAMLIMTVKVWLHNSHAHADTQRRKGSTHYTGT